MRILNKMAGMAILLLALVGATAALAAPKDLGEPALVVHFDGDSDELTPAAKEALAGVRAAFLASGKKFMVIRGFADPAEYTEPGATSAYGVGLSQRRSSNVRSQVSDQALTKAASEYNARITIESWGEELPQGKGDRRRVEVYYTDVSQW